MKVSLEERDGQRGIEVTVIAPPRDPRVPRLLAAIRLCGGRISGYESASSARRRVVALADVCSVRTAGDHAELLLVDGTTLQSASRLGELEAALAGGAPEGDVTANEPATSAFVRVSRQEIVNLDNALTIRPEFGSRLLLGLAGGHQALVSRTYAPAVKRAIGIKS
jgi:DNA-binding LytR/AlgR family response regulator